MKILETERLILREASLDDDAFVLELLNQHSFKKYIGDRGVRDLDKAREYIQRTYIDSYRANGFGLYIVEMKTNATPIGVCGFVTRPSLPDPDIGFAFLPEFEKQGFAFEAASAAMKYGRENLKLKRVLAITTLDNKASGRLLAKVGLVYEHDVELAGETLKLFSCDLV